MCAQGKCSGSIFLCGLILLLLASCGVPTPIASPTPIPATPIPHTPVPSDTPTPLPSLTPSATVSVTPSKTATASATPDLRLPPEQWQDWPVTPSLSQRALEIYRKGTAAGADPRRFSKVGDCQNITSHFLGAFDTPKLYALGEKYAGLQTTLERFAGSWGRESQAVRPGYNVAAVLSVFQADPAACKPGETPLACEVRLWNPSIALVSMETWYAGQKLPDYEKYLRQIVDYLLSKNVLPLLATKADNVEGEHIINKAIARVAYEYDLPLWNFWKAVQPLPGAGLVDDGFHLTRDPSRPDDPLCYRRLSDPACAGRVSWAVRNLTAVQAMEAISNQLKANGY